MDSVPSVKKTLLNPIVLDVAGCQHYWVLDSPAGPLSRGVCRACGEEKDFPNYIEASWRGNDVSLEQLSGGNRILVGISTRRSDKDLTADEEN